MDSSSDRLEEENREKQLDMKSLQNKIKLSTGDGSKPEQPSRTCQHVLHLLTTLDSVILDQL